LIKEEFESNRRQIRDLRLGWVRNWIWEWGRRIRDWSIGNGEEETRS